MIPEMTVQDRLQSAIKPMLVGWVEIALDRLLIIPAQQRYGGNPLLNDRMQYRFRLKVHRPEVQAETLVDQLRKGMGNYLLRFPWDPCPMVRHRCCEKFLIDEQARNSKEPMILMIQFLQIQSSTTSQ